ncbi:MAG TPA: bifunctional hydroxymethylpyrimidine kinase/phosphomethylpyrimidine kinase [Methanocorpusculum sp.]|nr:bifunctional hydroxymethylpyrimidine kinase/phosphomethylpyrimidine kinase [Methanocorpusculum sp.]
MTLNYAVSIAGSDSSGGAGLQTDIKTMNACGVWGMTVVAALTAQNGTQVTASAKVEADFIAKQIAALCAEFPVSAWKTGMLNTAETVHAVAGALPADALLVVDPVIVATSGAVLLDAPGVAAVTDALLSRAAVVTPNIPETEYLSGIHITDTASIEKAGQWFREQGASAVLIKGGHNPAFAGSDFLIDGDGFHTIEGRRLPYSDIHGTGCCLSSAIAAYLAQGKNMLSAVKQAKEFVSSAIEHSVVYPSGRRTVNPLCITVCKD